MEQTLLTVIVSDAQNCVCGIEQSDPHLLAIGAERLNSHCTLIENLATQEANQDVQSVLVELLQKLQDLRACVNSTISLCNEEGEPECHLNLDSVSILEFRKLGIPWSKIANLLGISRNSLYKFRKKHHLGEPNATMSDMDLRLFLLDAVASHPNAGVVMMQGALLSSGFCVSKQRVWQCLREIDPIGISLRRRRVIKRRVYKVKAANYLGHMDSTHKLIHFGFVIHGLIDGFSRKVIYVNVADNNTADTVLGMFKKGIAVSGLPRRVRGDRGVENVRVRDFMEQHSPYTNPFIHGRSVHNIRIERLWRDVNYQEVSVYQEIFFSLEEEGCLDTNSVLDKLCLSYVYMPRIQKSLNEFVSQWNNHPLRTMRSRTPEQLWLVSMRQQGYENIGFDSGLDDAEDISVEGMTPDLIDKELIFEEFQRVLPDPLFDDFAHGKTLYKALRVHLLSFLEQE